MKKKYLPHIPEYHHSIKNKLLVILLLSTIIPIILIMIFTYTYTSNSLRTSAIEENTMLLKQGERNIEQYLQLLDKATLTTYEVASSNDSLVFILKNGDNDKDRIHRSMNYIDNLVDYIEQVNLYNATTNQSYVYRNYLTSSAIAPNTEFRENMTGPTQIEGVHKLHSYFTPHLVGAKKIDVFSFHRTLYDIPSSEVIGYLSIDVNKKALEQLTGDLYNEEYEELYIVDDKTDVIMYSSSPEVMGKKGSALLGKGIDVRNNTLTREDYLVINEEVNVKKLSWQIYKVIPNKYLYKSANELTRIIFLFAVATIIIIIILAIVISIHFTSPIDDLIYSMERVRRGDLDTDIEIKRDDEFGVLAYHYKSMMNSLKDMITYKYHMELVNKENQIKVLQSQINPHFFSNVLQAIGTEALKHHDMAVYQLLLKLGKMMNYTMDNKVIVVPLEEEISYCINYLELQKLRFGEAFTYDIEMQHSLNQFKIPKMVLQPIIENYFKHGFRKNDAEQGYIIVRCFQEDQDIKFIIENNGNTIPLLQLEELQDKLDDAKLPEDKIGLLNISNRLRMHYTKGAKVVIENKEPQGIKMTITINQGDDTHEHTHS